MTPLSYEQLNAFKHKHINSRGDILKASGLVFGVSIVLAAVPVLAFIITFAVMFTALCSLFYAIYKNESDSYSTFSDEEIFGASLSLGAYVTMLACLFVTPFVVFPLAMAVLYLGLAPNPDFKESDTDADNNESCPALASTPAKPLSFSHFIALKHEHFQSRGDVLKGAGAVLVAAIVFAIFPPLAIVTFLGAMGVGTYQLVNAYLNGADHADESIFDLALIGGSLVALILCFVATPFVVFPLACAALYLGLPESPTFENPVAEAEPAELEEITVIIEDPKDQALLARIQEIYQHADTDAQGNTQVDILLAKQATTANDLGMSPAAPILPYTKLHQQPAPPLVASMYPDSETEADEHLKIAINQSQRMISSAA